MRYMCIAVYMYEITYYGHVLAYICLLNVYLLLRIL